MSYRFGEIMISKEQLQRRVEEMGRQISADYDGEPVLAICVLKGGVFFMTDLVRAMDGEVYMDFMACSSYGSSTRSSGVVRIVKDLDGPVKDLNVLIVEDIIDSGLTLEYLKDYLEMKGAKSVKIATMLDKPAHRKSSVRADYVGFEVDDRFIVGYGLDYAQKYRNLPYISFLEEEEEEE